MAISEPASSVARISATRDRAAAFDDVCCGGDLGAARKPQEVDIEPDGRHALADFQSDRIVAGKIDQAGDHATMQLDPFVTTRQVLMRLDRDRNAPGFCVKILELQPEKAVERTTLHHGCKVITGHTIRILPFGVSISSMNPGDTARRTGTRTPSLQ